MTQRLNYNIVAHQYDAHPSRCKTVDANLRALLEQRDTSHPIRALDIACCTGTQQFTNHSEWPDISLVGMDLHKGMLKQAQLKTRHIPWLQATAETLPFANHSFDYVSMQYAFHHVQQKANAFQEIFRILHPQGQFVMHNICPHEMPNSALYRYFPMAQEMDLQDFMPPAHIRQHLKEAGFATLTSKLTHFLTPITRQDLYDLVRHKAPSQCHIISEAEFQKGVAMLESEISKHGASSQIDNEICLLEITADKK